MLDKLQKQICRTADPSFAASLEFLTYLFYRSYFGRYSFELAELVSLPYSRGRSKGPLADLIGRMIFCHFLDFL